MASILTNWLQVVIGDLVEPEQKYAVKGRSIQNNLQLTCTILERWRKDDMEAMLINLDQSRAFDRVDHRFLPSALETAGFKPDFHKWISVMYCTQTSVVQVNQKCSKPFVIFQSVHQGCPLSSLLYILALELLLRKLKSGEANSVLCRIALPRGMPARVSTFADDFTIFVSCLQGIKKVAKALTRYETVTAAKINHS